MAGAPPPPAGHRAGLTLPSGFGPSGLPVSTFDDTAAPAPPPGATRRQRRRLSTLHVLGLAMLVLLAAALLAQARLQTLRRADAAAASGAPRTAAAYEAEAAYLRLAAAWPRGAAPGGSPNPAELERLLATWLQRLDVAALAAALPAGADDEYVAARQLAEHFAARARTLLAERGDGAQKELPALAGLLDAAAPAMRRLGGEAVRRDELRAEAAAAALRRQDAVATGLGALLLLATLAFVATARAKMQRLRERCRTLEGVTHRLRAARRDAEQASEAKSAYLANMSHEIRPHFQGLIGELALLRDAGLQARQVDRVRAASESAERLQAIVADLLDLSQLQAGRLALAPAATDLRALLREVEGNARPRAAVASDIAPGVPERCLADAARVRQVLSHLVAQAALGTDRGRVTLQLRALPTPPMLEFTVRGSAAAPDAAAGHHPFEPRRDELSRTLARLMGGDITAPAADTRVFTMPLAEPPAEPAPAARPPQPAAPQAPPAAAAAVSAEAPSRTRALRVLVAEDHPINREYIASLLEGLGHEAHFTANGSEAVEAIRQAQRRPSRRFDVVLMDLQMPQLDGIAATRVIRALPERDAATVPIVALTADAFEQTRERCLVAGMNDFLSKPVSPQRLAATLRRLFGAGAGAGIAPGAESLPAAPPLGAAGVVPLVDPAALLAARQALPPARGDELLAAFFDQGSDTVARLRAAVRDAQTAELQGAAHAAQGAALQLGLSALAATAAALHDGASHLPAHEIARLVQRYDELLPLTREAVAAYTTAVTR
jgi:CheY-like chemotaxis protein